MLGLTAALLFGYANAASYEFTVKEFTWDHNDEPDWADGVYLYIGGYKGNGELLDGTDTAMGGTGAYIFNDTDDATYRQWFLTAYAVTNTSEEIEYGYSNQFIELPDNICDHGYTFGYQDIWHNWADVCTSSLFFVYSIRHQIDSKLIPIYKPPLF